jgi:hypothetical protein
LLQWLNNVLIEVWPFYDAGVCKLIKVIEWVERLVGGLGAMRRAVWTLRGMQPDAGTNSWGALLAKHTTTTGRHTETTHPKPDGLGLQPAWLQHSGYGHVVAMCVQDTAEQIIAQQLETMKVSG